MHRRDRSLPSLPVREPLVRGFRRLAFWLAIVLPVAYLPLLSAGVDGRSGLLLAALLAVNLCCLLLGHEYAP
jgi:hypothetical protein